MADAFVIMKLIIVHVPESFENFCITFSRRLQRVNNKANVCRVTTKITPYEALKAELEIQTLATP